MSAFPAGSIRAAVAALGDAWSLVHEPNHQDERNESIVTELRDEQVMRCCDALCAYQARFSMLRRATFGMTEREARELIA